MGFISHKVKRRCKLEAGDHIYTWRIGFTYAHHGIYIGEDRVVHFSPHKDDDSSFSSLLASSYSSSSCVPKHPQCGLEQNNSGVKMTCLDCFLKDRSVYRVKYGVSKLSFISKIRGGTCTTAESDPPEDVIRRAMYLLDNGFGKYSLLTNNCEYFALYCKTGLLLSTKEHLGGCGQASSASIIPAVAVISAPICVVASVAGPAAAPIIATFVVGSAATAAVTYNLSRYDKDIGVRMDAVEVKVEDVAAFLADRGLRKKKK